MPYGAVIGLRNRLYDIGFRIAVSTSEPTTPPIADAGVDVFANANEEVTLDASGSYDPDGDIIQYTWTRQPDNIVLYSGSESTCTTKALGRVEEVIKLKVTDDIGITSEDFVSIFNTKLAGISQLQEQLAELQADIDTLEQQLAELQQQLEMLQVIVNENREAMEQFTPLQRLLEELALTLQDDTE